MTSDDTRDQRKDGRPSAEAAATELNEFINSFYRSSESAPLIDTSKDRFIALILANLQAMNNESAERAAHDIELLALVSQLQFYDLFLASRFRTPSDQVPDIIARVRDISRRLDEINQKFAVGAIKAGLTTRRAVAEALDVHENTVARWVNASDTPANISDRHPIIWLARLAKLIGDESMSKLVEQARDTKTPLIEPLTAAWRELYNQLPE